jgi:starvation-inducible DNA-binding protein
MTKEVHLTTTNMAIALNQLLANYKIYYHKLLNYQWLIQASATPELNKDLHLFAEESEEQMEAIVGQIEQLDTIPIGNWSKWQKWASIQFKIPARGADNILNKIIEDTVQLDECAKNIYQLAKEHKQVSIYQLASSLHQCLSSRLETLQQLKFAIAA